MIRIFSLLLGLLVVAAGVVICGLLTNWFRYGLPIEGLLVISITLVAIAIVVSISYASFVRNSGEILGVGALVTIFSAAFVLVTYDKAMGEYPHFYLSHIEKSPPALIQTEQGYLKYWIEIQNPFSSRHEEFLVLDTGKEKRIEIQIFSGSSVAFVSPTKPSDWATLSLTSEPDVAILTIGPFLGQTGERFLIDLSTGKSTKLATKQ